MMTYFAAHSKFIIMKIIRNSILFVLLFSLTQCVSLQTINSIKNTPVTPLKFRYYDAESKISYLVTNTDSTIHLRLRSNNELTITKILRTGLTVYLDPSGKKKRDIAIKYPLGEKAVMPMNKQGSMPENQGDRKDIDRRITMTSKDGMYINDEYSEAFSIIQSNPPVFVTLSTEQGTELIYDLTIPISKISKTGKSGLSNLSIGIITGSFDEPDLSDDQNGPPTGTGQPVGMGGRNQQREPQIGTYSELTNPGRVWFKVVLL